MTPVQSQAVLVVGCPFTQAVEALVLGGYPRYVRRLDSAWQLEKLFGCLLYDRYELAVPVEYMYKSPTTIIFSCVDVMAQRNRRDALEEPSKSTRRLSLILTFLVPWS